MDEICFALCERIFKSCKEGYEVFYEDELIEVLPENFKNRETLEAALKKLVSDGCVDVKYARGNAFCIAALARYELPAEQQMKEKSAPLPPPATPISLPAKAYALIAVSAFSGSIISTAVALILGALT